MTRPKGLLPCAVIGALLVVVTQTASADDNAVIKGKVIFKGDPKKYKREPLNVAKDPNCTKQIGSYDVIIDKDNNPPTLRNVLVAVKDGLGDRKFPVPTSAAVLDQNGCEYVPHVLPVMEGQTVTIRNSDNTNHNINFFDAKMNEKLNMSQPKQNMGKDVKLKVEAPFKVKCDVHPWMGMQIAVFNHPFFSVTGKEGTYEIKGLPPGKYVVEAWHEKFGTMTSPIEVTSDATKDVDFTFEPDKK